MPSRGTQIKTNYFAEKESEDLKTTKNHNLMTILASQIKVVAARE